MALLIFMRSGLTFSVRLRHRFTGQIVLDVRQVEVFARLGLGGFLGLRPRLAPVLAGASAVAEAAFGGRPGFFFTTSSVAVALTGFFTSSLAVALSDGLAGDFVRGTGFTFVSGFTAALGMGLGGRVLTTLSLALAGSAGLITFLAAGFAAGLHEFSGLLSRHEKYLGASKKQKHKKRQYNPARADRSSSARPRGLLPVHQGQDVWANIWGAVLAGSWRVGRLCPRLAGVRRCCCRSCH